jgi:hypothetical protein
MNESKVKAILEIRDRAIELSFDKNFYFWNLKILTEIQLIMKRQQVVLATSKVLYEIKFQIEKILYDYDSEIKVFEELDEVPNDAQYIKKISASDIVNSAKVLLRV